MNESNDDTGLSPDDAEAAKQLVEYSDEKLAKLWLLNGALLVLSRMQPDHDKETCVYERTSSLVLDEAKRRGLKIQGRLN